MEATEPTAIKTIGRRIGKKEMNVPGASFVSITLESSSTSVSSVECTLLPTLFAKI